MALRRLVMLTFAMIIIIELTPAHGQSSDCTSTIVSLAPCLNYISGSSNTPSVPCCSQLAKVVQSDPKCLCLILNGGASQFGVTINQTRALALPGACSVTTPPVSRCKEGDSPAAPPGSEPTTGGGNSKGSFLRPATLPTVISVVVILLAFFSFPYLCF